MRRKPGYNWEQQKPICPICGKEVVRQNTYELKLVKSKRNESANGRHLNPTVTVVGTVHVCYDCIDDIWNFMNAFSANKDWTKYDLKQVKEM